MVNSTIDTKYVRAESVTIYANDIIVKIKYVNGKCLKRRWNVKTKKWVDKEWHE